MRRKLQRWGLPGFPRRSAASAARLLVQLRGSVAPRVQVAVLRTIFNGWVTGRRFQRRYEGLCCFARGGDNMVEHYLRCRVVRDFAWRRLRLDLPPDRCWPWLLLAATPDDIHCSRHFTQRLAILHYVIYRVVHRMRHLEGPARDDHFGCLGQALVEAVLGHPSSTRLLSEIWAS